MILDKPNCIESREEKIFRYVVYYFISIILFTLLEYINSTVPYLLIMCVGDIPTNAYLIYYCGLNVIAAINSYSILLTLLYILYSKNVYYTEVYGVSILKCNQVNILLYIILIYQLIQFIHVI